ncbi:hypothetical protein BaRGS_00017656 [Batillaria attramentaria]|uniref:L-Fucosyltransferase n=1 Tax=Batillaria attramentaria TaxID=370345 RepID=A0ABD0KVG0_9CAEN
MKLEEGKNKNSGSERACATKQRCCIAVALCAVLWFLFIVQFSAKFTVPSITRDSRSFPTNYSSQNPHLLTPKPVQKQAGSNPFCEALNERLKGKSGGGNDTGMVTNSAGQKYSVTSGVYGRLGNQMFQYASLLGISQMNNRSPFFPRRGNGFQGVFRTTHVKDRSSKGFQVISEKTIRTYDPKFESLPQADVYLMQYLQSWKYFHCYRDLILREFTFLANVQNAAAAILNKYRKSGQKAITVGVHVRRGDLLMSKHVNQGYRPAPKSYLDRAADYMRKKYRDVIFIVASDDVNWCKKTLTAKDFYVMDRGSAGVDLAVLASCDHVIMTLGTFGWWAGYLSGGDVIYYNNSAVPKSHADVIMTPEDFFLPTWVGLGD